LGAYFAYAKGAFSGCSSKVADHSTQHQQSKFQPLESPPSSPTAVPSPDSVESPMHFIGDLHRGGSMIMPIHVTPALLAQAPAPLAPALTLPMHAAPIHEPDTALKPSNGTEVAGSMPMEDVV
jgi:hypothetical protein